MKVRSYDTLYINQYQVKDCMLRVLGTLEVSPFSRKTYDDSTDH